MSEDIRGNKREEKRQWLLDKFLKEADAALLKYKDYSLGIEEGFEGKRPRFKHDPDNASSIKGLDSSWRMGSEWLSEFYWRIGRQTFLESAPEETLNAVDKKSHLKTPRCIPNDYDFVNCFYSRDKKITRYIMTKFAAYTDARLIDVMSIKSPSDIPDGISVIFGPACIDRVLKPCIQQGKRFIYIDHAYFNRGYSKSGNPMSLRVIPGGIHPSKIIDRPTKRFKRMKIPVRNWRTTGSKIIICPPTGAMLDVLNIKESWLIDSIKILRKHTDRPIFIRPKPGTNRLRKDFVKSIQKFDDIKISPECTLEEDLKDCWAIVAPASAASIEAVCLGIPSFSAPNSPAAPVSLFDLSKIETPIYPDRKPFLNSLSYNQFNVLEIESGFAWNVIKPILFSEEEMFSENGGKYQTQYAKRHRRNTIQRKKEKK